MKHAKFGMLILFLLVWGCAQKQPAATGSAPSSSSPIYDEHADAQRDIDAAIAKAEANKRNIVLIFGANW